MMAPSLTEPPVPESRNFLTHRLHLLALAGQRLDHGSIADQFSLWMTLASYLIAVAVVLIAPFLAYKWAGQPFPGFLIEQTGVIADQAGIGWSGPGAGMGHPERVVAIDGRPVNSPGEIQIALQDARAGKLIRVTTELPEGARRDYNNIVIRRFPRSDLVRLFWLPYAAGLAFLLLGGWVFLIRGETRPGRAFAFLCVSAAITLVLLFDLITTHALTATWTIMLTMVGGSLFSLAMLFPEEWLPAQRQPWLRYIPYVVSLGLAAWGLTEIRDTANAWDYIQVWGHSYRYMAGGILAFLLMMVYRLRTNLTPEARRQAHIILWGSLFAFIPLVIWLVSPLFGLLISWNVVVFLPLLMLFPLSIGFAILRYRLWDIEVLVNRTLVYTALSILLGLIYIGCVLLFETLTSPFTRNSQIAVVFSTLAIVALFNPLRLWVQNFIDIRFYRRKYNMAKTLATFGASLRDEVDLERLVGRMEEVIWETMHPTVVHTWLAAPEGYIVHEDLQARGQRAGTKMIIQAKDPLLPRLRFSTGAEDLHRLDLDTAAVGQLSSAGIELILPLVSQGDLIGWIGLGRRMSQHDYTTDDRTLLANLAAQAAPAVRVAQMVRKEQAQALENERIEHELHLARTIQLALLPKFLPSPDGWTVAAHYQPARAVGGDFYDFIPFEDGRLGLVIGDVTGKGVPAALVMATTRSIMRAVALQGLSPGQVLRLVNNQLEGDIPDGMFVTCLYAILEPASGQIVYANAGHNLPYMRSGRSVTELRAHGMPLGLMPEMDYEEKRVAMTPDDCLLLYSDGLVEAHNPEKQMFGSARLRALLAEMAGKEMTLIECSLHALAEFTGLDWEQEDDITMVMLYRSPGRQK